MGYAGSVKLLTECFTENDFGDPRLPNARNSTRSVLAAASQRHLRMGAHAFYVLSTSMAGAKVAHRDDDDPSLILKVANGDRLALAHLYDRYSALLLAVGKRILGDAREAEDLLHDVFLEIWRSAGGYDGARGSVRAWMLLRMRSRALDRRKAPRVARAVALVDEGQIEAHAPSEDPHLGPDRMRVRQALAELPPEQRAVLELGYFEGLSSSEIAARIATPIGTVKSRVAAGLAKLRAGLQ
jgi:RNA polymerase sigma-70 factor (ECF subfamily)